MKLSEPAKGKLPDRINKLIETTLKEISQVECQVTIVTKPGRSSGTQLTLTIDSPVNYDEIAKCIEFK